MSWVSSDEALRRVAEARTRCYVARYTPVLEGPAPPPTLEIRREGPLTAIRWESLDRLFDATVETLASLGRLLDALEAEGRRPAVDALPVEGQTALADALHARGYRVARHQALLAVDPRAVGAPASPEGVTVEEVDDGDAAAYAELIETYGRGQAWNDEEGDLHRWLGWVGAQYRGPGWARYLARVDGRPAGAGLLRLGDGVAYLANAATDPALRGRGVQRALLDARLARAAAEGYEVAGSDTTVHSTSMRNMQRAGLVLVANLPQWRPA